jgi:cobalamin synthase
MAGYALQRVLGLTGDLYGALNELVFTLTVLGVVVLQGRHALQGS